MLHAQAGSLDPSFSSDGYMTHGFFLENDFGRAVIEQPDGRILVAGNSFQQGSSYFGVMRLLADGSLDLSFDTVGYTTIRPGDDNAACFALALQPDGKIVLAGYAFNGLQNDAALVRLMPDGQLDPSFGSGGIVQTSLAPVGIELYAIAIQPDGKIVVTGNGFDGVNGEVIVLRYLTDGTLDPAFNGQGYTTMAFGNNGVAYGMALESDGDIVVAGYVETSAGPDVMVARFLSNGSLDNSFGAGGVVITDLGLVWERLQAVRIDNDNSIVVAGTVGSSFMNLDIFVARHLMNGDPDLSFDGDGQVIIDVEGGEDGAQAIAIQADSKILVSGYAEVSGQVRCAVARIEQTGGPDMSFGMNGLVTSDLGPVSSRAQAMTIQQDGKILVAGNAEDLLGQDAAVARYFSGLETGITERSENTGLLVYPIPANDRVFVELKGNERGGPWQLRDASGRTVREGHSRGSRNLAIDVLDLPAGTYALQWSTDDGMKRALFVR
ncbi:MAG: hypothetical protein KDB88_00010 [Flavobacteriales bacterium]|nr:hypothetical protein [Flavobacteriales bacterium]